MIPIKDRRIVLLGGAGFIGHNLALHLKSLGAVVSVVDGLQVNNYLAFVSASTKVENKIMYLKILHERQELLREADIPIYVQDVRDYHALGTLMISLKPQVIIHLAAVAHADRSNKDPYSTFDHSFRTLENALDCYRERLEHFIYFSSSMVYGNFKTPIVTEETICEPVGIYGALKLGGEHLVTAYNQVFDLPVTIVRPSALYGERCVSRRVGQIFIEKAISGNEITITGDGADRLDFTYIDDLTAGIVNVIENEASRGQIFNLTYGESRSLADMANIVAEIFPHITIKYVPKDKLVPTRGTLSVDKARRLIGYSPKCPLEKGMAKYIEWYGSSTGSDKALDLGLE